MNKEIERQSAVNLLKVFVEEKNWAMKDYMERYLSTLLDTRKFLLHDLVSFSIAIVGIVIPILLSSNLNINRTLMFFSFSVFILYIIMGIGMRFIISRREIISWPKTWSNIEQKIDIDINEIAKAIKENNFSNINKIYSEIESRHKTNENENEKKSVFDKFLNFDYWLFGLFVLAFSFLSYSILKVLI